MLLAPVLAVALAADPVPTPSWTLDGESASASADGSTVVLGGATPTAVDTRTCAARWTAPQAGTVAGVVGELAVLTTRDRIVALDLADGAVRWTLPRPRGRPRVGPAGDGVVVIDGATVTRIDGRSRVRSRFAVQDRTWLAVHGGRAWALDTDAGAIHAIDWATGEVQTTWSVPARSRRTDLVPDSDGATVVTPSGRGEVTVWRLDGAGVHEVRIVPHGARLSAGQLTWRTPAGWGRADLDGTELAPVPGAARWGDPVPLPDGAVAAVVSPQRLEVFERDGSLRCVATGTSGGGLGFLRNGALVHAAESGFVREGIEPRTVPPGRPVITRHGVVWRRDETLSLDRGTGASEWKAFVPGAISVDRSDDGAWLVVAGIRPDTDDRFTRLLDARTGVDVQLPHEITVRLTRPRVLDAEHVAVEASGPGVLAFEHGRPHRLEGWAPLAWSGDGQLLAVHDGVVRLADVQTGRIVAALPIDAVTHARFAGPDHLVALRHQHDGPTRLERWRWADATRLEQHLLPGEPVDLDVSDDGATVAALTTAAAWRWSPDAEGLPLTQVRHVERARSATHHPTRPWWAIAWRDGTASITDETGRELAGSELAERATAHWSGEALVALQPAGVVRRTVDAEVRVAVDAPRDLSIDTRGRRALVVTRARDALVVDFDTGQAVTVATDAVDRCALAADGEVVGCATLDDEAGRPTIVTMGPDGRTRWAHRGSIPVERVGFDAEDRFHTWGIDGSVWRWTEQGGRLAPDPDDVATTDPDPASDLVDRHASWILRSRQPVATLSVRRGRARGEVALEPDAGPVRIEVTLPAPAWGAWRLVAPSTPGLFLWAPGSATAGAGAATLFVDVAWEADALLPKRVRLDLVRDDEVVGAVDLTLRPATEPRVPTP